jgi:propionyl-CoA carboxylase alpha chain
LQGVTNNRDFLVAALRSPEFLQGETTTDFIERVQPVRTRDVSTREIHDALIATCIHAQAERRAAAKVLGNIPSGWRNSIMPPEAVRFRSGEAEISVTYRALRDGTFSFDIDDQQYAVAVFGADDGRVDVEIDGRRVSASVSVQARRWLVHGPDGDIEVEDLPRFPTNEGAEIEGGLVAPMPGNVTATHVAQGDKVEEGQLLLILVAMKMEHRITAPMNGTVTQMRVSVGDQVDNGELLVVLEGDE